MNAKTCLAAAAIAAGLYSMPALADVYRCVLADGSTAYADAPCPANAALAANITEDLQICTTEVCRTGENAARAEALEQLRREKTSLAQMQELRLQREARETDQENSRRLALLEGRLGAEPGGGGVYYPAYGWYGDYGGYGWKRQACAPHCGSNPDGRPFPHHHRHDSHFVRGVRFRF